MTRIEALQQTLAGEHAAVYVYGVLGGRVSRTAVPDLAAAVASAYAVHRARRDQLTQKIRDAGSEPVASEVAYELRGPALTPRQIEREALGIEERCAAVYAETVASTSGADRQWAIDALGDAAVRALGFGADPEPFPGLSEL